MGVILVGIYVIFVILKNSISNPNESSSPSIIYMLSLCRTQYLRQNFRVMKRIITRKFLNTLLFIQFLVICTIATGQDQVTGTVTDLSSDILKFDKAADTLF